MSRSECFVRVARGVRPRPSRSPSPVAPTTNVIALLRRSSTPSTDSSAQIAVAASIASPSAEPSAPPLSRVRSTRAGGMSSALVPRTISRNEIDASSCRAPWPGRAPGRRRAGAATSPRAVVRVGRDPGAQPQREAGVVEALVELTAKPLGREERGIRVHPGQHDDELVAAEAGRRRAFRADCAEHEPDLAQQRVAELVTGAVVDVLEVVAVEHDEAQRPPILLRDRPARASRRSSSPRRLRRPVSASV